VEKDYLILKRASASRPSGEWNEDDFDVPAASHDGSASFKWQLKPRLRRGFFAACALTEKQPDPLSSDATGRDGHNARLGDGASARNDHT
jgi:hypothetical protein